MPRHVTARHVTAHLALTVSTRSDMGLSIAVADDADRLSESLRITSDGEPLVATPIGAPHGGRLHQLRDVGPAQITIDYAATVVGPAPPIPVADSEWYQYIRPSRYCESDRLGPLARAEFAGLDRSQLLD